MTIDEARANLGKPFKYQYCIKWDIIKEVSDDWYITGDFLCAPVEDCRLKQEIPEGLKKYQQQKEK